MTKTTKEKRMDTSTDRAKRRAAPAGVLLRPRAQDHPGCGEVVSSAHREDGRQRLRGLPAASQSRIHVGRLGRGRGELAGRIMSAPNSPTAERSGAPLSRIEPTVDEAIALAEQERLDELAALEPGEEWLGDGVACVLAREVRRLRKALSETAPQDALLPGLREAAKLCREDAILCDEDREYDNTRKQQDGDGTAFNRGVICCDQTISARIAQLERREAKNAAVLPQESEVERPGGQETCRLTNAPAAAAHGTWILQAPTGVKYVGDSPLAALRAEQNARIPAGVQLERIFAGLEDAHALSRSEGMVRVLEMARYEFQRTMMGAPVDHARLTLLVQRITDLLAAAKGKP